MKSISCIIKSVTTGIMLVCGMNVISAQSLPADVEQVLEKYGHTYVSMKVGSRGEVESLGNIAIIDRLKGDSIVLSVDRQSLLRITEKGYHFVHTPIVRPAYEELMIPPGTETTLWNFYPTWQGYDSIMQAFSLQFPGLCKTHQFFTLVSGRKLMVCRLTSQIQPQGTKPLFLFSSSIHGDETAGFILMLHLIDYLLSGYGTNPEATWLLDNMEIWICPLANPDGTYHGGNNSVQNAWRYNANGIDLNRNYPDPRVGANPDQNPYQPETFAFMGLADTVPFTMSANLHGGSELVNYPWDTWLSKFHPDDAWWIQVSRQYADTVHVNAPSGFFTDEDNGITNGAAWYVITGGRQDYMNYFSRCREVTIELSTTKLVAASQLITMWNYHSRSLINYMKEGWYGIRGQVTDSVTGLPMKARVWIDGHDSDSSHVWTIPATGYYFRPVLQGSYSITFSAPGYYSKTIQTSALYHDTTLLNAQLVPVGYGITDQNDESVFVWYDRSQKSLRLQGTMDEEVNIRVAAPDGKVHFEYSGTEKSIPLQLSAGVWLVGVSKGNTCYHVRKILVF
jgi:hypothetical protein